MLHSQASAKNNSKNVATVVNKIVIVSAVAIAYYSVAELSRHLASTPQDICPLWPSAGIAVATILRLGNRAVAGVLVGSFFAEFFAFFQNQNLTLIITSFLIILGIAIGNTAGVWMGTFLVHKALKNRHPLDRLQDVVQFLFLSGILAPAFIATVGVTALYWQGKIAGDAYLKAWLIWWVSEAAGVFVVAPMLLCFGRLVKQNKRQLIKLKNFRKKYLLAKIRSSLKALDQKKTTEIVFLLIAIIGVNKNAFSQGYPIE